MIIKQDQQEINPYFSSEVRTGVDLPAVEDDNLEGEVKAGFELEMEREEVGEIEESVEEREYYEEQKTLQSKRWMKRS